MSAISNTHCRLCATIKTDAELLNLVHDVETREDIVKKLIKFNVKIEFNELPSKVCIKCVFSLNSAYEFILNIEKAQITLIEVVNIKKEELSSDDAEFQNIVIDVKEESNTVDTKPKENDKPGTDKIDGNTPLFKIKHTWDDYKWECRFCGKLFSTVSELKLHSIQIHQCCNPHKCADCYVRESKMENFLSHIKKHRDDLKLSCHICYKKFSKPTESRFHRKVHIKSRFVCTGCYEWFTSSDELEKHTKLYKKLVRTKTKDIDLINSLTCDICQKSFKKRSMLTSHLRHVHIHNKKFTCDKCGKGFPSRSNLNYHISAIHDDARPYECDICKFKFKILDHLRRHIGIHDGVKPFKCENCGKTFRLKEHLNNHSIVHTDKLPHVCSYCNKGFKFKTILNQHVRQHTGVKPYSCGECNKDFTSWPNYNKHMKIKHSTNMSKKKTVDDLYPVESKTEQLI